MADAKLDTIESEFPMDTANLLRTQRLVEGIRRLYSYEELTDLEIICQDRVWKVHKLCLCAQSGFFLNACRGKFLEANENKITLKEDDPTTVNCLIDYLYHSDYGKPEQSDISAIILHIRMHIIADKYLVEDLIPLATEKFEEEAQAHWDTNIFTEAIAEVYGSLGKHTPLRSMVIKIVKQHARDLLDITKDKHQSFIDLLGDLPEFGRDISLALMTSISKRDAYECPVCRKTFGVDSKQEDFQCPYPHLSEPNWMFGKEDWAQHLKTDLV